MKPLVIGIIPARWESSRFPGKPLAELGGRPIIRWVWENAIRAGALDQVVVATDDSRIARAVNDWGGQVKMTDPDLSTGTERVAAAMKGYKANIVVNIQGDEPFLKPEMIAAAVGALMKDEQSMVSTLVRKTMEPEFFGDPNRVKVVIDNNKRALYFSRAPIPFHRDNQETRIGLEHIGLYCYRADFLKLFCELPATPMEKAEKLEQLRVLESGYKIITKEVSGQTVGIDTPEDLARAREMIDV